MKTALVTVYGYSEQNIIPLTDGGATRGNRTPDKEGDLESLVAEHYERIFGEDSLYFSAETRLRSLGGLGSIPDGYAISLVEPRRWFIVEVELSSHRVYEHIAPRLNKFINGVKDPGSRRSISEALYSGIKGDPVKEAYVRTRIGSDEVYRLVSGLVDQQPVLSVAMDD